jgi:hypothetical protein
MSSGECSSEDSQASVEKKRGVTSFGTNEADGARAGIDIGLTRRGNARPAKGTKRRRAKLERISLGFLTKRRVGRVSLRSSIFFAFLFRLQRST